MKHRTLKVGSRQVVVETTPLVSAKTAFKTSTLHRAGDQLFVVKAPFGAKLISLLFLLNGTLPIYTFIAKPDWSAAIAGGMFLFFGLAIWVLVVLPRIEFDAGARRMRTCWLGKRWERPLQEVLAVQLTKPPISNYYELNLVVDDEKNRRMNLTCNRNWKATRDVGKELAAFLGVPLLDEVSGEKMEKSRL